MSESIETVVADVVSKSMDAEPSEVVVPPAVTPEPEVKADGPDLSSQFAAISRRERALLERERKLKQQEEELTNKSSGLNSWEEKKKRFKTNPDELLSEAGLTFDDFLNSKLGIVDEAKPMTADEMYKKIKEEMEQNFSKLESEKLAAIEAENAQVLGNFKLQIEDFVKTNTDKYELINYQGDANLVFDVIQEYFDLNGELLSLEQAADHVEKHLEDLVDGAVKLKKFAKKFAPPAPTPQPESKREPELAVAVKDKPTAAPTPTLSNSMTSSNVITLSPTMDVEESKRRAAALIKWK